MDALQKECEAAVNQMQEDEFGPKPTKVGNLVGGFVGILVGTALLHRFNKERVV